MNALLGERLCLLRKKMGKDALEIGTFRTCFHQKAIFMSYLMLVIFWVLFYLSHSLLASLNIKRKFQAWMGGSYKWYRLLYTLFSGLLFFGIFLYSAAIEPKFLLRPTELTAYLGYMFAAFGTIILMKSFKHLSLKKFAGLRPHDDLVSVDPIVVEGVYKWVRHPIYSGLLLVFMGYFFFQPQLTSLVHFLMLLAYLPFGIRWEEKKLMEVYGEKYKAYKEDVPALFPRVFRSRVSD